MQLPLTPDLLVPLGAGVVLLAALVVLWLSLRRGKADARAQLADAQQAVLEQADSDREAGPGSVPAAAQLPTTPPPPSFAAVPAHWSGGARPPGVPAAAPAPGAGAEEPPPLPPMAPAPAGPPTGPVPVAPWTRADQVAAHGFDGASRAHPDATGSSGSVAAAVAQAFAARAAAARATAPTGPGLPGGPDEPRPEPSEQPPVAGSRPREPQRPEEPEPCGEAPPPLPQGDVRDRLLAVLLSDPAVAVDATRRLDACRAQLERLSQAVRHEQDVLRDVLQCLADTGLRTDQVARLAGMSVEDVQALTAPVSSR